MYLISHLSLPARHAYFVCARHTNVTFGFMTASALNVVTAWPGRIAFFGFAFFIYMTVATYAANLAGARCLLREVMLSACVCEL